MQENPNKKRNRDVEKAAIVKIVADIYHISRRHIYRIINGENKNRAVELTFKEINNILEMARHREAEVAAIVKIVAQKHKISKRQVYRIRDGENINEKVLASYMFMKEGIHDLSNQLLVSVNKLVPFNKPKPNTNHENN
jgi:hypothetical protein